MRRVYVEPYRLRFAQPLRTAQGAFTHRTGWLLHLEDGQGGQGRGDAAPWPGFGTSPGAVQASLAALPEQLQGVLWDDPEALAAWLAAAALPVEVAHAVELAGLDLLGQRLGVPLARLLAPAPATAVPVSTLVRDAFAAQQAVRAGARSLKLKLGTRALDDDVAHVAAVRCAVGDAIALRLDANGAWPLQVALRAAKLLSSFAPQWLEQPVAAADVAGLAQVRRLQAVPVAADEAVQDAASLRAVLAAQAADVVVLKPMFAGGPRAALRLAALAAEQGVQCVVTHALESAVGRMGAAHVAAALAAPAAAGLANPLAEDVAVGPITQAGAWHLPAGAGLGLAAPEAA